MWKSADYFSYQFLKERLDISEDILTTYYNDDNGIRPGELDHTKEFLYGVRNLLEEVRSYDLESRLEEVFGTNVEDEIADWVRLVGMELSDQWGRTCRLFQAIEERPYIPRQPTMIKKNKPRRGRSH